ncbi:adenosylmethionine--8-amino-7-oxononanoate transaminase [Planctomycetota bacterium]
MNRPADTHGLRETDRRCVWHPFTQMQEWTAEEQVVIAAGEGNYLIDTDGNRYLDAVSSLWCNLFGHRRPEIDKAVQGQLARIAHSTQLGLAGEPAIRLAEKIIHAAPEGLEKVFYSDSGSEAVEIALKIAYQHCRQNGQQQRSKLIAIKEAYHGDTIGSVSVGGIDLFHATFKDLLFGTIKIPTPHCYRCPFGLEKKSCGRACFKEAESIFETHGHEVCALVTEPIMQGAAGMLKFPKGFLAHLRKLCTRHGVFMIVDEVAAGFGRTGRMFACEHEEVRPDLMCLGKGLTGGYLPVAATVTTDKVYQGFLGEYQEFRTFFHGHTYTGNQLGCAAGLGTFEIFENNDVISDVAARAEYLGKLLDEYIRPHPHCGDIRLLGLMGGIELVADRETRSPFETGERVGARVCRAARAHGIIMRPLGDVLVLMPPLSISDRELEMLIHVIADVLDIELKD